MVFVDLNPLVVSGYYVIFVLVAVSMNSLIIYLIKNRSPHIARNLKTSLISTSVIQILIAILAGLLQGRVLWSTSSSALLPVGPCRLFGPMACFITSNVISALTSYVELLIVYTMFCRYRMLQSKEMRTETFAIGLVTTAIVPIILLILQHTRTLEFDIIMEQAIREHPDHNLEKYGEFGGVYSLANPVEAARSLLSFVVAVASPIIMLFLKHRILKTLSSSQQRYTEKTVQSCKMFSKALTVQAMVPIACFLPVTLLLIFTTVLKWEFALFEYLIHALIVLPCAFDPLCTIYFVPPFRKWVLNKLCKSVGVSKSNRKSGEVTSFFFRISTVTS